MTFNEILEKRYACKRYNKEISISNEQIQKLINAAYLAPTSCNMQHYKLLFMNDSKHQENMIEVCLKQGTVRTAPMTVVILARKAVSNGIGTERYNKIVKKRVLELNNILPNEKQVDFDFVNERMGVFCNKTPENYLEWSKRNCYLVAMNIMNMATSLGLDTCPIEGFNQNIFNKHYPKYNDNFEVALILSIGYRAEEQSNRDRLNIEDSYEIL